MSWSDEAVSPCVYTPVAGELTLDSGLTVVGGKIVQAGIAGLIEEFSTKDAALWDFSASANVADGRLYFSAASWLQCNILKKAVLSATGTYDVIWKFTRDSAANHELYMGLMTSTGDYASCVWATYNAQMYFRIGSINMMYAVAHPANGTIVELRIRVIDGKARGFYRFNGAAWVDTGCEWYLSDMSSRKVGITGIQYSGTPLYWESISVINTTAPLSATLLSANAFLPTSPAKLATLPTAILTLDSTGAAGTEALYLQHFNDVVGRWESYDGTADGWTLVGAAASATTTYDLPTLPARAGEKVRAKLVFQSTDGTLPAPAFVSLSLSWTSDVSAPVAPTIASILGVGGANALCNLGPVPATARHLIAEVNIDNAGFVPLSARNKVESGQGSLEFLGPQDTAEQAGGRNTVQVLVENLTIGQTVQIRAKAIDAVGNASSATDSDLITIGGSLPELYIEDATVFSGGTANIRVHLVGQTDDEVTVDLATVEGTATDPEHFTGVDTTVTFAAGSDETHRWVDVEINAIGSDTILGTLGYTVELSNPTGATLERATGTVTVKGILVQRVPTHRMTFKQRAPMKLIWRQTA